MPINFATAVTVLVIIAALILALAVTVRRRRSGKRGCSGGCTGCPMSGECEKRK